MSDAVAVLIGGAPATGKSTLATALAARLAAAVLDLDVATGPLVAVVAELVGTSDLSDPRLADRTRAARYETLLALAEANLAAGVSVVLVAPFTAERGPAAWRVLTERLRPARTVLVWLTLPADELRRRLGARAASRDAAKLADPDAYLAGIDGTAPDVADVVLDARAAPADLIDTVLAHLSS